MSSPVLFEEHPTQNGMLLAIATLNSPQTLNGLSLEMVDLLMAQFKQWEQDPKVAVVVLQGKGDKAFCAGADLQDLYKSMGANTTNNAWNNVYAREFFEREYRLNYYIHTYAKPFVCWGHGIVLGGGVGLMMGASHRVASETLKFAMPETAIGLFPDVGSGWFLNKMPGSTGLFLALTGVSLNTSDALDAGLVDYHLHSDDWPKFIDRLLEQPWAAPISRAGNDGVFIPRSLNDGLLNQVLNSLMPRAHMEPGPMRSHSFDINSACNGNNFDEIYRRIVSFKYHNSPWLVKAAETMKAASPGSARLAFTILQRTRMRSLEFVFRTEYVAALACTTYGDLKEGIRARLIDKDRKPRWNPADIQHATADWVLPFFEVPWPEGHTHPLEDLGAGKRLSNEDQF